MEAPVHGLFARAAARSPDSLAVEGVAERWSYRELDRSSLALAQALRTAGVEKGAVVAVLAWREPALVEALLGVLRAGAAFAVLDPAYPAARLAQAARLARPAALVALPGAGPVPPELGFVPAAGLPPRDAPAPPIEVPLAESDLAYVAFTSGTTGQPKGILGPHGPLPHFVLWHAGRFSLGAADRFAMLSGLAHDPLLRDVFTPLALGASLHVPDPRWLRDPPALRGFLRDRRVTVVHLTPSLARLLCHGAPEAELPDLRWAFLGGEPLDRAAVDTLRRLAPGVTCVNFYGATETPQAIAYHVVTDSDRGRIPVGRGIEGVDLLVLDEKLQPCERGEVCVRTEHLSLGYIGGDEAGRFARDPETGQRLYRTGDLGRMLPDGEVEVLSRADGQFKIRGFRVEPGEVEAALASHPGVQRAIAGARGGELFAWVEGRGVTPAGLRRHAQERLPEYMVPRAIALIDSVPLTPAGKVDLDALPEPRIEGQGEAPRGAVEEKLAAIWAEVLGVSRVGRGDSFFDLGGDSLSALILTDRIARELGRRIAVNALLAADTVEKLASTLQRPARSERQRLLVALEPAGARPPVYWLPGGGGLSVLAFRQASRLLGPDQPVYGLEAELDPAVAPRTLPDLVRRFLEEIVAFQPRGPYFLLGFSLGSYTAYEMALQLRAQGREVGMVGVFDTAIPGTLTRGEQARVQVQRMLYRLRALRAIDGKSRPAALAAAFRNAMANAKGPPPQATGAHREIIERNMTAAYAYARGPISPYRGRITVFLAQGTSLDGVVPEIDPRIVGWRRLAREGVEVRRVRGNHLSMLEPPAVEELAGAVRSALDDARRRVASGPS